MNPGEPLVLLHRGAPARFPRFHPGAARHARTPGVEGPITFERTAFRGSHHQGWLPGVLDWDEESAAFLGASYGEVSPDGAEHFPVVIAKLDRMHAEEPTLTASDLAAGTSRTLVMTGDDDEIAFEMYNGLPDAELAIVPGTSHGLLVEKPDLCNMIILEFLTSDPVQTFAPIRRAGSTAG